MHTICQKNFVLAINLDKYLLSRFIGYGYVCLASTAAATIN